MTDSNNRLEVALARVHDARQLVKALRRVVDRTVSEQEREIAQQQLKTAQAALEAEQAYSEFLRRGKGHEKS